MKVFYFNRDAECKFHMAAGSYIRGVYVPDENIILSCEQGAFGEQSYDVLDSPGILEEIKAVISGETPNVERVTYSGIKEFECEDSKVKEIIQNAKLEKELRAKVSSGIEELLEQGEGLPEQVSND